MYAFDHFVNGMQVFSDIIGKKMFLCLYSEE